MPQAPTIITYKDWLARTNRKKLFSSKDKDRSGPLTSVDGFVDMYEKSKQPRALELLKLALDTWLRTKKDGETIRDHQGAVSELQREVTKALRFLEPLPFDTGKFPGVYIANDFYRGNSWVPDDFVGTVKTALGEIASKPVGEGLLRTIAAKCEMDGTKKVIIEYTSGSSCAAPVDDTSNEYRKKIQTTAILGGEDNFAAKLMNNPNLVVKGGDGVLPSGLIKDFVGNDGSSAVVVWNPRPSETYDDRPPFIGLVHELIHSYHYLHGACFRGAIDGLNKAADTGLMEEEMRTVGFGRYADEVPSENAVRKEHQIRLRPDYDKNDWPNVVATIFVRRARRGAVSG